MISSPQQPIPERLQQRLQPGRLGLAAGQADAAHLIVVIADLHQAKPIAAMTRNAQNISGTLGTVSHAARSICAGVAVAVEAHVDGAVHLVATPHADHALRARALALPREDRAPGVAQHQVHVHRRRQRRGELIAEAQAGLLVPYGQVDALAGAIRTLLNDRAAAAGMVARGQAWVRRHAAADRVAAAYLALYGEVAR